MRTASSQTAQTLRQRLVTLALAVLLGWSLQAAITLPAGSVPAIESGQMELSLASSPYGEWLADQLLNRSGLRAKSPSAAGSGDEEEDSTDSLALLRLSLAGRSPASISRPRTVFPVRLANPRTSPLSPRAPPAAA